MSISREETLAGLHVLIAVAQADGKLHADEKQALASAIEDAGLEDWLDVAESFSDPVVIDHQIAMLRSDAARDETFRSAYSLAYADGECSKEERELLDRLKVKLDIPAGREEELRNLFDALARERATESIFQRIEDPEERAKASRAETMKCSMVSAVLGAFPLPGLALLTDFAVLYLQLALVRDLGAMHGQVVDRARARGLLAGVGVGTTARLAVSNLAKLVPGWGSLVGATTSFASSYAIGVAFDKHFGAGLDEAALAAEFAKAKKEGTKEYDVQKASIEERGRTTKQSLVDLAEKRRSGVISEEEFQAALEKV